MGRAPVALRVLPADVNGDHACPSERAVDLSAERAATG
jgi:hypothetical protein